MENHLKVRKRQSFELAVYLERYLQPEIWSQIWRPAVPIFSRIRRARSIRQHEYVFLKTSLKFAKKKLWELSIIHLFRENFLSGLEISAGHWPVKFHSLTGKYRRLADIRGLVNFLIKKYVQKWSRLLISMFPKKCMSVCLRHFVVRIRYTASIVP